MTPLFQSHQKVIIHAPLKLVREFNHDLTKITEFYPRVDKVDLLSGKSFRGAGVACQCHLKGGKHACVEKNIEIVPIENRHHRARRFVWNQ